MNRPGTRSAKAVFPLFPRAFLACILILTPQVLLAHAVLVKSTPMANATLPPGTLDVVLQFNSRVDGSRSTLLLAPANGSPQPLQMGKQTAPNTLNAHASGVNSGTYALEWQVLSADGHLTRGSVPFQVK